jgi:hypothetical protein
MSKKSAAFEAKFEIAVKILLKAPNLTVQEAMAIDADGGGDEHRF